MLLAAALHSNVHASSTTVAKFNDPGSISFNFVDDSNNGNGVGYLSAGNSDLSVVVPTQGDREAWSANASFISRAELTPVPLPTAAGKPPKPYTNRQ